MKSNQKHTFNLALVTGASSGIGTALCNLLAEKGIPLLITGRDVSRLNALAEKLKPLVNVVVCAADLSDQNGCNMIIERIHEYSPDLVINNAGFGLYGEALTYETKEQLEILNVNGKVVLELTLESARSLISSGKKGVILNVSSAAGMQIFPCMAVYAAAKAFVNQVSESLDFEMRPHGIRVLAACPGMVSTAFGRRAAGKIATEDHPAAKPYHVMTAEFAAEQIWWQIEKQKPIYIFDWKTRFATYLSRFFVPKSWVARLLTKIIEARHPPRSILTRKR